MPFEKGGRADKLGNRYEYNYAILKLLEVIEEEIYSVTYEAVGDDEKGVDLWFVNKDGKKVGEQCKARNGSKDKWEISDIKKYKFFDNWKYQLDRDKNYCVSIVSPIPFILLEDIGNRARNSSGNGLDFYENQILKSGNEIRQFYKKYCEEMKLDINKENDLTKSLNYLQRTSVNQIPSDKLKSFVIKDISYYFVDDAETVYNVLLDYIINKDVWGKAIDFVTIKKYLDEKQIKLSNLAYDKTILPRIETLNEEFNSCFNPINNYLFFRDEYKKCEEIVNKGESIIISGKAGYGKSGLVQIIANSCRDKEIPYIAIKLDKKIPGNNTKEWGKNLGFPNSISYCLDSISKDRKAVIILDQLDALKWTQINSYESVSTCRQLIDEVIRLNEKRRNKISIVLVCRSYDLKYDNNIKILINNEKYNWSNINVEKISEEEVKKVVGKQYEKNSKRLNELLQIPSNLYIWCHLDKSKKYDDCYTTNKLVEAWWQQLLNSACNCKIDSESIQKCINEIIRKMVDMSCMNVMRKFLSVNESALNYLYSNEFLFVDDKGVSFTHQRLYDYFIEVEMMKMYYENKTIEEIIGDMDQQLLSKRYQIQMFLEDLYSNDIEKFIKFGKELLLKDGIRFFIKEVFLEVLGQIEEIDSQIEEFILEFLNDKRYGKYIINNVIQCNVQYVKILLRNGILDKWMENDEKIELCLSILRKIQNNYDSEIAKFLENHLFKKKEIDRKIYRCFSFDVSKEIDEIFELRMKIYKRYPELSEEYIDFKSLFKVNEMRAIRLIKFWIENNISNKNKRLYRYEEEYIKEESDFIIKNDEEIINMLLPCIPIEIDENWDRWSARNKYTIGVERIAVNVVKKANNNLIKNQPDRFWNVYEKYMGKGYHIYNEFLLEGFVILPEQYSNKIIEYLCDDFEKNIFECSSGNKDELFTAKKVIEKHSKTCSIKLFRKLENTIYYFIQSDSVELYRSIRKSKLNQNKKIKNDWWGNLQVELIPYLCKDRISEKTNNLMKMLDRKFDNGSNYFHYSNGHGGSVWSPISGKRLTDKQWLKILTNEKIKKKDFCKWKEVDGGFIESSLREFAISFGNAVSDEPNRMIDLVLNNKKNNIEDSYINSLYNGLCVSKKLNTVPNEKIERLLKKFSCENVKYREITFCNIVEKKKDTNWSENTLNLLENIAINNFNTANVANEKNTEINTIEMLKRNSLYTTVGAAASTIAYLIYNKNELLERFKELIKKMINDENFAVKFASLSCLYTSYYIDKEWTTPLIIKLFKEDQRLLSFNGSVVLLLDMCKDNKKKILKIIKKLYNSKIKELKEIGAFVVAQMYFINNEFVKLVNDVKRMDKIQEEQILRVLSMYFNRTEYNEKCKDLILEFNKNNCNLENFINRVFYEKEINLERDKKFLIKIIKSDSGRKSIHALVKYLEEKAFSILDFSEIILEFLKSYVKNEENQEIIYLYSDEYVGLLVELFDEVKGKKEKKMKDIANQCLDIIDKMYEKQIASIDLLTQELSDR